MAVLVVCTLLSSALPAAAQGTPPNPDPGSGLSPEELQEIEAAVGKDQTASAPDTPSEAAPGSAAPLPVPRALSNPWLDMSFILD
ncbi:peptide methionine tyrosine, partial [Stigmatella aurantiaca DW4/3-1]